MNSSKANTTAAKILRIFDMKDLVFTSARDEFILKRRQTSVCSCRKGYFMRVTFTFVFLILYGDTAMTVARALSAGTAAKA